MTEPTPNPHTNANANANAKSNTVSDTERTSPMSTEPADDTAASLPLDENAATPSAPRPVLASTIVWGIILLAIAAFYAAPIILDLRWAESPQLLGWGFTGLGVVVVLVGLLAALRKK